MNRSTFAFVFVSGMFAALPSAQAQTPPPVSFRSLRVVPDPTSTMVRAVLQRAASRFAACDPTGVAGTVGLRMTTGANGEVASSRQRGTDFTGPNAAIASCVVSGSRRLRFLSAREATGQTLGTLDIEVTVVFGNPSAAAAPPPAPPPAPPAPPAPPPVAPPPAAPPAHH